MSHKHEEGHDVCYLRRRSTRASRNARGGPLLLARVVASARCSASTLTAAVRPSNFLPSPPSRPHHAYRSSSPPLISERRTAV